VAESRDATSPAGVASGFVPLSTGASALQEGQSSGWGGTQSFAAIAREIAATVDGNESSKTRGGSRDQGSEEERASLFVQVKRRRRHVNHVTVTQVVGLVLLLVVGLAAEYKYVGHGNSSGTATVSALSTPSVTARLPVVPVTRVAGTLFDFATSGSAESAPFQATSAFTTTWTTTCGVLEKATAVDVAFETSGRQATNIDVPVTSPGSLNGVGTTLPAGIYTVIAHSPGTCSWTVAGRPST
jgi:hypothetical protein